MFFLTGRGKRMHRSTGGNSPEAILTHRYNTKLLAKVRYFLRDYELFRAKKPKIGYTTYPTGPDALPVSRKIVNFAVISKPKKSAYRNSRRILRRFSRGKELGPAALLN